MPSHQERRDPLPADYQFPTPEHVHTEGAFDPVMVQSVCRCGARLNVHSSDVDAAWFFLLWNVIEGEDL